MVLNMYIKVYGVMLLVFVGGWLFYSHYEAKSFNRLTKSNVTLQDAMFVQLRVIRTIN